MMAKLMNLRVLVLLAAVAAASIVGVATAAPPDQAQNEHARIVEFWTHARVAQAVPRDFVLDANGEFRKGPPAGKGPGGGGGEDDPPADTAVVTGASWAGGGSVQATTGKVLFALGSSYYVCSASVVADAAGDGDSLVLTAAHCAYDGGFATNWTFIPDYDSAPAPLSSSSSAYCDDTAYGCWTASALTVHNGYASAASFGDALEWDFAVATVGPGGKTSAELDVVLDAVDGVSIPVLDATPTLANLEGYAFGYPAAKKYKGNDLVYCSGIVGTDAANSDDTYQLLCDMTGGSSGGPWFSSFDPATGIGELSSLNSYGYRGSDSMYGPMFNSDTQAVYNVADGGSDANVRTGAPGSNP